SVDMGPVSAVPPLDLDEGERKELEKRVREVLIGGYASRAELAELAEDYPVTEGRRPVSRRRGWRWLTGAVGDGMMADCVAYAEPPATVPSTVSHRRQRD
ncbi:hypothetical protein ACFC6U_37140, partial [Kitasatospora purpeofusca]